MENKLQARLPKTLGYLGLIPIVVSTIMIFLDSYHLMFWRNMLLTYAVVILSFLGALHWAFAMTLDNLAAKKRQTMMVWSVLPSLIAWVALFIPPKFGFLLLSCFFVFALLMDIKLAKIVILPTWYIPLRFRLTVVMTSCLMATAFLLKPLLINA
jgi:hypothetical protein